MSENSVFPHPIELSIDEKGDFEIVSAVTTSDAPRRGKSSKHKRDLAVTVEGLAPGYDVSSTRRIGPGLYEVVLTKVTAQELATPIEVHEDHTGHVGDDSVQGLAVELGDGPQPIPLALPTEPEPAVGAPQVLGEALTLPQEVAISTGEMARLPEDLGTKPLGVLALNESSPALLGLPSGESSPQQQSNQQQSNDVVFAPDASSSDFTMPIVVPLAGTQGNKRWYQRRAKGPTFVVQPSPRTAPQPTSSTGLTDAAVNGVLEAPLLSPVVSSPGQVLLANAGREAPVVEIDASTGLPKSASPALAVAEMKDLGRNWRGQKLVEEPQKELPERPAMPLWDYFAAEGLATPEQLDVAYGLHVETSILVTEALVAAGAADESALVQAAATFSGLEVCDLPRAELDPAALDLLPESIAREHRIFPLRILPDEYVVALAEPNEKLHSLLTQASGSHVTMYVARPSDIVAAIDQNYHALFGINELVEEFEADEGTRRRTNAVTPAEVDADNAPIVRLVNRILSQAMRDGASDVHIEPADEVVRVRSRVDGVLKVVLVLPAAMGLGLVSRIKIMAEMNIVERRRPQDGTFTIQLDGRSVDVRVATVATIFGESCVLRLLDKTKSLLSISDLGMAEATHKTYSKMIRAPFGMVLCVGPTGSGKTTTLYASLNEISDVARNVMTIEDPVEYVFPSINQIQTNEQAGLTFATGLKSILRQDSDVVLVGEIRDVETARIAVQSTLTGHFVLSSIHATDAIGALTRFIDMGIEPFLIASSLVGLVGQRLVRRTCISCSEPYEPTEDELDFYTRSGGPEKKVFLRGSGCNTCGHTGYKGRVGVYELVPMSPEMKRLIVGFATEQELRDLAKKQGIRTMQDEAIALISRDLTTPAEVIRSIYAL